jgi:Xaa-Pro aminopeptidase
MLERGCEIIYDIIVASGGNTSPYRRWATDKMIRQGDLVIVDINAVGPGGYFIDFVRNFKCAAKMTAQEVDLYKEVYDSMYAGIEMLKPGNSTWDVVEKFPKYDDDVYGTCTLQQFAHSIGLTLYEGMWMSRGYSKEFPAEIKENMYFAIETFAGHPRLRQTSRLEENVLVSKDGPVVFTQMEHLEETGCKWEPKHGIYAPVHFTAEDVTVVPDDAKWNK